MSVVDLGTRLTSLHDCTNRNDILCKNKTTAKIDWSAAVRGQGVLGQAKDEAIPCRVFSFALLSNSPRTEQEHKKMILVSLSV